MGPARLRAFRIGSGRQAVFQGEGARLHGARWNSAGRAVIYCGGSFAIAMLERLVYSAIGSAPTDDRFVEVEVPDGSIENLDETTLPGWRDDGSASARAAGDRWLIGAHSLALSVPSAVTVVDRNLLVNPAHPEFARLAAGPERPVAWDRRLFGQPVA